MSCCHGGQAQAPLPTPSVTAHVVAAVLAVNSMGVALATNLNELTPGQRLAAHGVLLAFCGINLALLGRPLAAAVRRSGLRSVAGLFAIGLAGALTFSAISTARGHGPVYYEVVSILLVIYSAGRALTAMAQRRVVSALAQLTLHDALCAVRRGDGPFVQQRVDAIAPGDELLVRPGGVIVVDGEVLRGTAYVQTASLTGESQLRRVAPGDRVQASWFCADASLLIRASRAGTDRRIDGVAKAVTQATAHKRYPPSPAERVAAIFVPTVLGVATLTFAGWAYAGPWDVALMHALAVTLVACPCAFGFAAPIGLRAGTQRLAGLGIVVRQSAALEALAHIDRVVFDKTGTLTRTCVDPAQTQSFADDAWTPDRLLGLAAAAQALVHHPISEAFAPWQHLAPPQWQPLAAKLLPGCGISVAVTGPDGEHTLVLGDPAILFAGDQADTAAPAAAARALLAQGHKPMALLLDNTCLALFALKDSPFVAPQALAAELLRRHIRTQVLSGDGLVAVQALGLPDADAHASLTPVQKLEHVRGLQQQSRVCFVGDGINDSAALGIADVAVSMHAGSDLARELADLVLPAGRPESLLEAIDVARHTARLIRQNFAISLSYNAVGMAVAAAGFLNPVAAALLMAASSLTVSARSLAMLRPKGGARPQQAGPGRAWPDLAPVADAGAAQ